ncbi:MAG: non-hydrolyzing UDP-N-acetylglucosamine 2-epimerase [Bacteroidia bacterium]
MKILTIVGARPQFVKAAVLSREFKKHSQIKEVIVHTGQHFDKNMSDIFFEEMEIPKPDYNLNINGLSHGAMTGQMLEGIEKIIINEKPDYVLVYGDTNSTLAGALAAKKLNYKVIHVEAGLRSFNLKMPEEINRILTDRISDILFCPTDVAIENLKKEGFDNFNCKIYKSGDVMEDASIYYKDKAILNSNILKNLNISPLNFILSTVHRAENTDDINSLSSIINALNYINKDFQVVVPLHPRTKKIILENNIKVNFMVIEPLGYFDILMLLANCKLVLTDSGGMQKEAFYFNKFCITLRDQTEWVELVKNGYNFISGANEDKILNIFNNIKLKTFPKKINLYGDGKASANICNYLLKNYEQN